MLKMENAIRTIRTIRANPRFALPCPSCNAIESKTPMLTLGAIPPTTPYECVRSVNEMWLV
jgi:hypothetical protein